MTGNPTPTRGVPVQLAADDRVRHLRYSMRTLKEIRAKFGDQVLSKSWEGDAVAELLWYGLKHEDPNLTIEQIEDLVDLEHLEEIMKAVKTATGGGRVEEVKRPPEPVPVAPPGAGDGPMMVERPTETT